MKSDDVVIVAGVRTPFAKSGTALKDVSATELGRVAVSGLLSKLDLDPERVDEVIMGCVAQPVEAPNLARVVALQSGMPKTCPGVTVQKNCASGMEAITAAYHRIRDGSAKFVISGGTESMSNIPLFYPKSYSEFLLKLRKAKSLPQKLSALRQFKLGHLKPIIGLELGLTDPICGLNMGQATDQLAREMKISREEQDQYALLSHQRASKAQQNGIFQEEIVPVYVEGKEQVVSEDVGPRHNQTMDQLGVLRPYFDRKFGTVTVGNACPITDGAVAVAVTTYEEAKRLGYEPLGAIRSEAYSGVEPQRFAIAPALAISKALDKAGLKIGDMDLVEINEAFSAVIIGNEIAFTSSEFAKERLGKSEPIGELDRDKLNVNGGAIALGHPVGASGARIILTLLLEMQRKNKHRGVAAICVGGGLGGAVVVER